MLTLTRLVRPLSPDEVPALPTEPGRFLKRDPGGMNGMVDAPALKHGGATKKQTKQDQKQDR